MNGENGQDFRGIEIEVGDSLAFVSNLDKFHYVVVKATVVSLKKTQAFLKLQDGTETYTFSKYGIFQKLLKLSNIKADDSCPKDAIGQPIKVNDYIAVQGEKIWAPTTIGFKETGFVTKLTSCYAFYKTSAGYATKKNLKSVVVIHPQINF